MKVRNVLLGMKLGLILTAGVLSADFNDDVFSGDDTSPVDMTNNPMDQSHKPYFIRSGFDYMGKAKFSNNDVRGEKLRFDEFDIDGSMVVRYDPCRKEGLLLSLGYSRYTLDWKQNPYFNEDHFNLVSVGLGFFSHRLCDWNWKGMVKMNFNPSHLNFQNYVTWDILLWGRHDLSYNWGLNLGFFVITGMKIDRIYPIVGLDWTINDQWKINAIFPVNFSVIYTLDCNWSFALASRFWDIRQRTGKSEPLSKAIWEYRNVGMELGANYKYKSWNFNAHGGYSYGGRLKISDQHKRHSHRLNFDGAPYVGAELAYTF